MPVRRKEFLVTGEIYHIFNKTVGNEEVFSGKKELERLDELVDYYRFNPNFSFSKYKHLAINERNKYLLSLMNLPKIVEIYAFAFMPNHFHLLLKQLQDGGIKTFSSNIQNGFAKYYNIKNDRLGSLFVKPFKSKRITRDEIFLHVSRYIHLNPVTSYLVNFSELTMYPWTSYTSYINKQPRAKSPRFSRKGSNSLFTASLHPWTKSPRFSRSLNKKDNSFVNTEFIIKLMGTSENYVKFVANQSDYQRKLKLIKNFLYE